MNIIIITLLILKKKCRSTIGTGKLFLLNSNIFINNLGNRKQLDKRKRNKETTPTRIEKQNFVFTSVC